jgi:PAS domain S-box-containing protein
LILESANEASVSLDERGVITDWNAHAEGTFGYSREEALGRALADTIIAPADRDAHWSQMQRLLESGEGTMLDRRPSLPPAGAYPKRGPAWLP